MAVRLAGNRPVRAWAQGSRARRRRRGRSLPLATAVGHVELPAAGRGQDPPTSSSDRGGVEQITVQGIARHG